MSSHNTISDIWNVSVAKQIFFMQSVIGHAQLSFCLVFGDASLHNTSLHLVEVERLRMAWRRTVATKSAQVGNFSPKEVANFCYPKL